MEVLKGAPISDPQQLFDAVKSRYNEELNLVWLQPFGFDEPRAVPVQIPAQAAPVVRKDTLNRITSYNVCYTKLLRFESDRSSRIHDNNLYGNSYNFRLGDFYEGDVRVAGNWWGTADPAEAAATVYDRRIDSYNFV